MSEQTLPEWIRSEAVANPDAIAVRQWDAELTYRALIRGARELAEALRVLGVGPESRVVVCVARRPHLVTAVLGVLAAGGAYVPLEPGHPAHRRDLILGDAGAAVAVVDEAGRAALAGSGLFLVGVPGDCAGLDVPPFPDTGLRPDNAAYALYTSGSTGSPKAVVVSHRSVAAFTTAVARDHGVGPGTLGSCFASLGFDTSVMEMFVLLTTGGTVCLIPEQDRVDPQRLQRFLHAHHVSWAFLAPAVLPLVDPDRLPELRCLVVGGEAPGPEQVDRWTRTGRRFLNYYGPTETTVAVSGADLSGVWTKPVPIGRALPNHTCRVLGEDLRPVAPGEPGELCVSGAGLARGYLGRPGLTAERFVPDPYSEIPGARMYRTGDLALQDSDGTITFLGRVDGQVKINGQRVETGETASVLRSHPTITHAAVEAVQGPAGAELVAYVTPETAADPEQIRDFCADRLPSYMIPRRIVRLGALPLTSSDKVDFAALRPLAAGPRSGDPGRGRWQAPLELAVVLAWSELLGSPDPGPDDDFFGSGGDSLLAMRLAGRLRTGLGLEVRVADVFESRTLIGLVERLERTTAAAAAGPTPGHGAALTAAQRRLWFIDRLAPATPAYNIAVAERLRGPLDVAALEAALADVAARHEVLRWRVPDRDGMPYVVVAPPGPVALPVDQRPGDEALVASFLEHAAQDRFDLARGPLWRVRLLNLGPDDNVLALTIHHIVFDGWSLEVLYRDLAVAYASRKNGAVPALEPLVIQYGDYAAWLAEHAEHAGTAGTAGGERAGGSTAAQAAAWWLDRLAGAPAVLDLPRDRDRPAVATFHGAAESLDMPQDVIGSVRDLARSTGVTEYSVLLTAFSILLRRLTGADDLLVAVPVADRRHTDLDGLLGFFVDTVPVRLRVADDESFAAHLAGGHQAVLGAMEHRDVPFERLVEALKVPRDLSRNPLVQVMFNMYGFGGERLSLAGIDAEEAPAGLPGSLFDMTLYAIERNGSVTLQAVYNPDLYGAPRIAELLRSFVALTADLTGRPELPISAATARPADSALPDPAAALKPAPGAAEGLLTRISRTIRSCPDAVAVSSADRTLSYRDLGALIRAVAAALRKAGVGEQDAVGVLGIRTAEIPAVLLGVLASGGRWLVADPGDPEIRTLRRLRTADVRALIVCPGATVPAGLAELPAVRVDDLDIYAAADDDADADADGRGAPEVSAARATYLMPTSGTTGEPQLVLADDQPLARFLDWYCERFGIGPQDSTALVAGLSHDPLLRDLFTPLVVGGRVCVPDQDWLRDPARLTAWLAGERVTVLHLTPQLGRLLATAGPSLPDLRLAVFAGDRLAAEDVRRMRACAPNATIVNGYGATETPQLQGVYVFPDGAGSAGEAAAVPIGPGVPGTEIHVLTPAGKPAAVGEIGEIVIRGRNLALGYLDPERTAARFTPNPASGGEAEGDRMFATGDLGRYDAAGLIVPAGRGDHQVKVRGHRVELGEVEAALAAHPDVAAAVATVHTVITAADAENQLFAYAVPRHATVSVQGLRDHLARSLPEYARPAAVSLIPAVPLTPNGKVDRAALPAPAAERRETGHSEPATATEKLIASVWREVLGKPRVGRDDNFFEIGGHSLALVAVQARLRRLLRPVDVVELFRSPTVRALAAHFDGTQHSTGLDRADRRVAAQRNRRRRDAPARRSTATRPPEETP